MTQRILNRSITEPIHIRADEENGKRYIEGYAIVFNQRSKLIREWGETFYEVIEPTAPDNVLRNSGLNVIATVDHSPARMLGRTKSGTLELTKDERGLKYRIQVPDTQLGRDMAALIERGDYYESSFIFSIAEKGYRYDRGEDTPVRYISDFASLRDVSIVIDGAYANTEVKMRSQEWENLQPEMGAADSDPLTSETDILTKQVEILKIK
jgi:uncharacterized protein